MGFQGDTQNIGDLIKNLARTGDEVYSLACKFVSIDSDGFAELEPLNGDPNLIDVKLIAGASDNPLLVTPAVDSVVLATFLSKDTAFISLYSDVESIELRGSDFGGVVKVEELVAKINRLEDKVNDLITKFNSHTHLYVPGANPAIPTPAPTNPETPITQNTVVSDLENENVKHG